jgi:hypothetical protein
LRVVEYVEARQANMQLAIMLNSYHSNELNYIFGALETARGRIKARFFTKNEKN